MRRLLVIVLLSLAYAGCARTGRVEHAPTTPSAGPHPVPPPEERPIGGEPSALPPVEPSPEDLIPLPEPRFGGEIRFLVTDPSFLPSLIQSNVAEGLTTDGLLLSWSRPRAASSCWVFELNPRWSWPDGVPVQADDLVRAWAAGLADRNSPHQWLLAPVALAGESDGETERIGGRTRATGRVLEICPGRESPDLPQRLEHPALWLRRVDPVTGALTGPGPFRQMPDGTLSRRDEYPGAGPYVDRVVPLEVEGHSPLLLRLGDAHLAVTFGQAADSLIEDPAPDVRVDRLPTWDRTYFLWMNPGKRWVNDPFFRSWVAGTIDRDEMVAYLFDDRGTRAFSLSRGGSAVPVYPLRADRPLSPVTEPRLQMVYDVADPYAKPVAQRVQAVLEAHQVELSLVPLGLGEIRDALREDRVEIALLAHRPGSEDPVLALEGTVWWLGPGSGDARARLVEASGVDPRQMAARAEGAWEAEKLLLGDARLVPLIRLYAWLAHHPSLAGLDPGPDGEFRLEEAWWLP